MAQAYHLTEGKVSKLLLRFYFPMLFTSLLQQIYSIADTAIVGKGLGDQALAAVGNMSPLSLLIIGFATGMTNGFAVMIAQSYGARQQEALRKAVALSISLSLMIALCLTALSLVSLKHIAVAMKTSELILQESLRYGYIVFGGLAATIAYNLCASILRALGDSKTPLFAIVFSTVMNILLDYMLIFLFGCGVEGAAIATVFSQALSALICYMKLRHIKIIKLRRSDFAADFPMIRSLLKNGIPTACMNSITAVGCVVVQSYVNNLGVAYTSAYSACSKYLNLFMLPSITAGHALSAFTSQNYGAQKYDRIREGVRVVFLIALISYLLMGPVIVLFPQALAGLMLTGAEPIALFSSYMRILGMTMILMNLLFVFRYCNQGMGHPLIPMCSGILEMVFRILVIGIFLPKIGFPATAFAEAAAWLGALTLNLVGYLKFRQKKFIS